MILRLDQVHTGAPPPWYGLDVDRWALSLDATDGPMFLRIARAIARDIGRGRLKPGAPLPGSRTFAATLGVHRNTVLAAYRELEAEGYTETLPARETRVRTELPERAPRRARRAPTLDPDRHAFPLNRPPFDVVSPPPPNAAIALLGGLPDLRLLPTTALARAYRRAVTRRTPSLFGYGDPRGEEVLRRALAVTLSRARGLAIDGDDVLVTRGSQMALFLAARTLVAPGEVVLVEGLGYRPAWEALRAAGAKLEPIVVDRGGIDVSAVRERCERGGVRAIYVTPHHQYPTTVLLSSARRLELLAIAREHQVAILEDDYDHEFHYEGRPVLPLKSADEAGSVVYLGSFSKVLAPALRVGFLVAPRPLLTRAAAHRAIVDRQGDRLLEHALADLMEEGELLRHARRMRRLYQVRRGALVGALTAHLGDHLSFELPVGGMALWAHARGVDVDAWAARCGARGVVLQTARRFTFDAKRRPYLRLGFAAEPEARIQRAVEIMAACLSR